nr:MAG TPA: hypothetical protein [Caudoviricetes sp.]
MANLYKSSAGITVGDKMYAFPTFASLVQIDGETNANVKSRLDELTDKIKLLSSPRIAMYTATYTLDGWAAASDTEKTAGYNYKQTAKLVADSGNAPAVTANSEFVTVGSTKSTGVASTDMSLQAALGIICDGYTETADGNVVTLVKKKPSAEVAVRWAIMT